MNGVIKAGLAGVILASATAAAPLAAQGADGRDLGEVVFAFWDRNGDDALTEAEMRFAMTHDFRRVDLDDDTVLTLEDFLQGFTIMIALRAAIRPDHQGGRVL